MECLQCCQTEFFYIKICVSRVKYFFFELSFKLFHKVENTKFNELYVSLPSPVILHRISNMKIKPYMNRIDFEEIEII